MDQRTQQLLTAPAMPLLLSMSAPNSVAFLIQASVSMAEVWFIGRLGSASLAAIALVFPLLMLFQTLSGGAMGGAVASAIARALGAGDLQRAETLIWHALALAAMGAVALLVVFLLAGSEFLRFLGGSGSVLAQALSYSYVLFFGGIFVWLVGVVSAIFRGMGNMRFPAAMMILSAFVQVPLSGLLITGAFGAPKLGVMGAAVSAVISSILLAAVMLTRLAGDSGQIRLTKPAAVFRRHHFADILQVALPASLSPVLTVATIIILTAIVGRFGEQALAGYGIGSRIEFLLIPLVFGIGASMTSLVGVGIGAGDIKRAEHIGTVGGFGAAGLAGGIGLILAVQPELWVPYFSQDPVVQDAATRYIQIVGPWFAFYGLGLVLYFGSQGAGAMGWPVVALSLRAVICVSGSVLLTETFDTGIDGIFYAVALSMVAYGVIMFCALKLGAWRSATLNAQD
ncbi:MAG TPA: MATE family efflux transporter [Gammaproteobacteria bacterium]|nr:MATE family efflux transporter [Gammaproteobacteria bacterium]